LLYISNNIISSNLIYYEFQWGINNKKMDDLIELIYLHLYKDTYLLFMQAYKPLHRV